MLVRAFHASAKLYNFVGTFTHGVVGLSVGQHHLSQTCVCPTYIKLFSQKYQHQWGL